MRSTRETSSSSVSGVCSGRRVVAGLRFERAVCVPFFVVVCLVAPNVDWRVLVFFGSRHRFRWDFSAGVYCGRAVNCGGEDNADSHARDWYMNFFN